MNICIELVMKASAHSCMTLVPHIEASNAVYAVSYELHVIQMPKLKDNRHAHVAVTQPYALQLRNPVLQLL
jgi:hypothetical protein